MSLSGIAGGRGPSRLSLPERVFKKSPDEFNSGVFSTGDRGGSGRQNKIFRRRKSECLGLNSMRMNLCCSQTRGGCHEFFDKFEKNKLGFLHQDETSGGELSRFNKFASRAAREAAGRNNIEAGSSKPSDREGFFIDKRRHSYCAAFKNEIEVNAVMQSLIKFRHLMACTI